MKSFNVDSSRRRKKKRTRGFRKRTELMLVNGLRKAALAEMVEADVPRSVAKLPERRKARLYKRLKRFKSIFKSDAFRIQEYLRENKTDNAIQAAQKQLLKMMIELIPIAESNFRKYGNERGAYAINAIISQTRELMADIRAEKDSREIAYKIVNEVVHPQFMLIAHNYVDNLYRLRKNIEVYTDPKLHGAQEAINTRVSECAKECNLFLQESYKSLRDQVLESFGE